jgi:lysophospholipase L1-like esterase
MLILSQNLSRTIQPVSRKVDTLRSTTASRAGALLILLSAAILGPRGCAACPPGSSAGPTEPVNAWVAQRAAELQRQRWQQTDLVLLGDSMLSRMPADISRQLSQAQPVNLAIAGAQTNDVLWLLREGQFRPLAPKTVILLIGANDVSHGKTSCEVVDNIAQIIAVLSKLWPGAQVVLVTMPKFLATGTVLFERDQADRLMTENFVGQPRLSVVDISDRLVCATQDCPLFNADHVHFNDAGYRVLLNALTGRLAP